MLKDLEAIFRETGVLPILSQAPTIADDYLQLGRQKHILCHLPYLY